MCRAAIAQDIELVKQISVVLHGEMKPSASYNPSFSRHQSSKQSSHPTVITQCCIHELYLQGREMQPAVDLAKSFERRKCNHREVIPGDQCIESVVGKSVLLAAGFESKICQVTKTNIDMSSQLKYSLSGQSYDKSPRHRSSTSTALSSFWNLQAMQPWPSKNRCDNRSFGCDMLISIERGEITACQTIRPRFCSKNRGRSSGQEAQRP